MTVKFSKDHEWVVIAGNEATIGITDYAQNALGDIVFIELPEIGRQLTQGREAAVVESVKAASDVYAPLSGKVIAVNDAVKAEPAKVNADPMGGGWLFKIEPSHPDEMAALMDEAAYKKITGA